MTLEYLSNGKLFEKKDAPKSSLILTCILPRALAGVSVYRAVKNGLGFFTFFRLLIINGQKQKKAVSGEIEVWNL